MAFHLLFHRAMQRLLVGGCGLLMLFGSRKAHAADAPGIAQLENAVAIPALERFGRVGIVASGAETRGAVQLRSIVASAFTRAGHNVVMLPTSIDTPRPSYELLSSIWRQHRANAVAVVRISTPDDPIRAYVSLYDLAGVPALRATATGSADAPERATWRVWPILNPEGLPGSALYEQIGRDDLIASYHRRAVVRWSSIVCGIAAVSAGSIWTAREVVATIDTDYKAHTAAPGLLFLAGVALLTVPLFVDKDPLSDAERRQLVQDPMSDRPPERGGGDSAHLSITPLWAPGSGAISVRGEF